MNRMQIAIQGKAHSFHHIAAEKWAGQSIEILPKSSFRDVFEALKHHETDLGVVATSNSNYGQIQETAALLEEYNFPVVGNVSLPISQHLIGINGSSLTTITHVYSHPIALAQCSHYLDTHLPNAKRVAYEDTSAAAAFVKSQDNPTIAAIAGSAATDFYSLEYIAKNIENDPDNTTTFAVIRAR